MDLHCISNSLPLMEIGEPLMKATIFKLGNSHAIRLSKTVMEALGIKANDEVSLEIDKNVLTIKKANDEISIDSLFKNYKGKYEFTESFDDEPVGKEVL